MKNLINYFIIVFIGLLIFNDLSVEAQIVSKIGYKQFGLASYYPDSRDGQITQGGYKFDKTKMYVAHKLFPFGSIISVRNV